MSSSIVNSGDAVAMHSQGHLKYLGIVRVPVTYLNFFAGVGERVYSQKRTDPPEQLFRNTSINHNGPRHWIDGYVDISEVAGLLRDLNLAQSQLDEKKCARRKSTPTKASYVALPNSIFIGKLNAI